MGATTFSTSVSGHSDAKSAFRAAVDQALWEHGHGGYTGSIAEKGAYGFNMVTSTKLTSAEARAKIDEIMDADSKRYMDKYGPCGCIALDTGEYVFFGLAAE